MFACTANEGMYAKECGFVASSDRSWTRTRRSAVYLCFQRPVLCSQKKITVKKTGVDYSFTTDRSINITATEAIPEALRNLPALNVDFG